LQKKTILSDFWDNSSLAKDTMQRLADLSSFVQECRSLESGISELVELTTILDEDDSQVEKQLYDEIEKVEKELRLIEFNLLFSGKYDDSNSILAIHAGAGGTESQDWSEMLLRMYLRWAESKNYTTEIVEMSEGDEAGIKSVIVSIKGRWSYGNLKSERGVHRLVRISPFDSSKSRHTSFALIEVLPDTEKNVDIEINNDDLRIDVYRAGGHGGQNVQKNSTAIRITHIPSGLVVVCQNERSQLQNKELAMQILRARLLDLRMKELEKQHSELKGEHISAEWGNQIRSYILHPYKMVKDHRTGFEHSDTTSILDGNIDEFLQAYLLSQVTNDTF
jgi:peptide chain release factor 2